MATNDHQPLFGENFNTKPFDLYPQTNKITKVLGIDSPSMHSASSSFHDKFTSPSLLQPFPTQPSVLSKLTTTIHQTNTSWHNRCEEIIHLCSACSNKELIDVLPTLLHSIFGYSGGPSWKLDTLTPTAYVLQDYSSILNFLKPNGFVFTVINKLMSDPDALFQLPFSMLPVCVTEDARKGMSNWYQSKVSAQSGNQQFVNFNAMEYFLILFSYFVIYPSTMQSQWTSVVDVLYVRLFEEYLHYFFPLNEAPSDPVPPVRTQQFTPKFSSLRAASSPLLRQHVETNSVLNINTQSSNAEIFLQILCDFWLGQNTEHQVREEYKLPSVDFARMVRILVKYLHMFINSKRSIHVDLPMAHLASVVIPGLFNKRLYIYLKLCFMHWPLDASFRMVLETWLSFIQPWRYLNLNSSSDDEVVDISILPWKPFISSNFHFYSVLFKKFISRAQRHDLLAIGDVFLIYRVAKVFSQHTLVDLLHEADAEMVRGHIRSPLSNASQFGGLLSPICLESSTELQQSLFGNDSSKVVQYLCESLASSVIKLHSKSLLSSSTAKQSNGWIARIQEFFINDANDFIEDHDEQKLIDYLEKSCHLLCNVFQITIQTTIPKVNNFEPLKSSLLNQQFSPQQPDCMLTSQGIVLTDKGRFQVAQGLCRFDKIYTGDPELQPVRSHESSLAVRWLYKASIIINNKFSDKIQKLYNRDDVFSTALRAISKKVTEDSDRCGSRVHPRVSLRFAASYYFMGYILWFMVLAQLFGFHWLLIVLGTIFILVICIILNVDSQPKVVKRD